MHRFWPFRDVTVPRTKNAKPVMRSLNLSVACWLSTIVVSWLASALILIYLHLSHKFTSPISYMHLCTLSALILCFVCNISLWTIQLITKMCASLTIASKDMAFIQIKYVAATVVSMFRLQRLVEYSTMENPKLIHSLTTCMKGGFSILLEKKKVDWYP